MALMIHVGPSSLKGFSLYDNDSSDLCVFDEVGALLARLGSNVKRGALAAVTDPRLEDGIVLCVDCIARVSVVIGSSRDVGIRKPTSWAASINAVLAS
jgi:hypothetical protein